MTDFHGKLVLSATPASVRIPLAARALGGNLFPHLAVDDSHAAHTLAAIGDTGLQWLKDRQRVYGVLARTRGFRDGIRAFLAHTPAAHVASLGCGLNDYLQWIENGQLRMTDADLPTIMTFRRALLPAQHDRHILADLDWKDGNWWDQLGLPATRSASPVCLVSEAAFMYLKPATVESVLHTFGERAPAGSRLMFDTMSWLSVGRARHHRAMRHTDAACLWGPRRLADLTRPHPRLALQASHSLMDGYNLFHNIAGPAVRTITGVPLYGLYEISAQDTHA